MSIDLIYLLTLLLANLSLTLPDAHPLRIGGALLLLGLLPGLRWSNRLLPDSPLSLRLPVAAALSTTITALTTLLLHYRPGPVEMGSLVISLNLIALLPLIFDFRLLRLPFRRSHTPSVEPAKTNSTRPPLPTTLYLLLAILTIAAALRLSNLTYSEFQGDEALAMLAAAEALSGHEDALFLRSKGPLEVLIPMAMWRLSGTINEAIARLPFALAMLWSFVVIYHIAAQPDRSEEGASAATSYPLLAVGLFTLSGFTVAFGRIVQYQAFVILLSCLAFALLWRKQQVTLALLSGLCVGTGLLAHYDAILVVPALLWLLLMGGVGRPSVSRLMAFLVGLLLTALPFYLPYSLDEQSNRAGAYVGGRIGSELRNNMPDFFQFNAFYSSFYTIILTSGCVLGLLIAWLWRAHPPRLTRPLALILGSSVLLVSVSPTALQTDWLDLSVAPFALLLGAVFVVLPRGSIWQAVIIWLAVPFLGYNFVVALGLTHIYTIVPAWSLLAAKGIYDLRFTICDLRFTTYDLRFTIYDLRFTTYDLRLPRYVPLSLTLLPLAFYLLATLFLWNAFLRTDVAYWQDYPAGNLTLFWTPYDEPPQAGFFGFVHRAEWKAVGQLLTAGTLDGDYGSNEEPDVTTWYTRGAPRACDAQPEFYLIAPDLIDPVELPRDLLDTAYTPIATLPTRADNAMRVHQRTPPTLDLGLLDGATLARQFDATAHPAAFARTANPPSAISVNFAGLVELTGYQVDTRRSYPNGRIPVTLHWRALTDLAASYHVFVHLINDRSGQVTAQADGVPVCWTYPTDVWRPAQPIADQHALHLPAEMPPGDYRLEVGLYLPETGQRLDWLDIAGNPGGVSHTLLDINLE